MRQRESHEQELQLVRADNGRLSDPVLTPPPAPGPQPIDSRQEQKANKWLMFITVAIGVFMATLDSSIVNIGLPAIANSFHVPLNGAVEWVIIAYLVATAAILLTAGRLADMIGRKAVWITGLVLFTISSALCGAALSLGFLIAMRTLQGLGGALMMAISPAMLTSAFPPQERGRALGLNAITVALGISIGPTIGGLITAYFSWRWIFYVNVPIGIIGIIISLRVLTERLQRNPGRFDPLGALLLAVGLAGITAGLSFGQELGWTSPFLLGVMGIGILALILLPLVEVRASNPIIVFSLLRNRVFTSATLSSFLSFMALGAVSFLLPFYFEQLRHFPTALSGLLLTPLPITLAVIAPFSGALADRIGSRWLAATGLTIACIGLVLISQLDAHSSIFDIVWRLIFTGAGQAIFQSPNNSALLGAAPRELQGSASGFLATARTMGISLSVALTGAIFTGLGGAAAGLALTQTQSLPTATTITLQHSFSSSFQAAFFICSAIAAIGIFASLVRGKEEKKKKG